MHRRAPGGRTPGDGGAMLLVCGGGGPAVRREPWRAGRAGCVGPVGRAGRAGREEVRLAAGSQKGPKAWGGKRLPAYKCLGCGGGTDRIPCTKCENDDINTFASIQECTACGGTGKTSALADGPANANPLGALFATLAGKSPAAGAPPGGGTRKLQQVACRTCKGQGVMLLKNSDWR